MTRGARMRPTTSRVRSAIFSMLGPGGAEGMRVLDLYAGTGALGIGALDRGASEAEFVERNERQCEAIRQELKRKGYSDRGRVRRGDSVRTLERLEGRFDLVFIDPPYETSPFEDIFREMQRLETLHSDATVFAEHSSRLDLPGELPGVRLHSKKVYGDTAVSVFRVRPSGGDAGAERRSGDGW